MTEASIAPGSAAGQRPELAGVWGDVLVAFGDVPTERLPGRAAAGGQWKADAQGAGWSLVYQERSSEWCGYPVRAFASGTWKLWLLGEVYGAETEQASRALAIEVATGVRTGEDLNGHLLLLAWDEAQRRWHAWTDRFGTLHAYFAADGSRAALGTCFPAVAAAVSRRRLDWTGLAGSFAFGFFPQDRTFFDDVRILRPATHFVFDERGRPGREERYWQWRHAPDLRRSYADSVEELGATLHRVLDDQAASGRVAVPISGGLDSRSTVAALTRGDRPAGAARLWSYSYGYTEDSVETRIAQQVASARRLPFEAMTIGPYLFDRIGTILSCVEGFQDITQSRQAAVAGLLGREADAVIAAHWGDVWLDGMGLEGRSSASETEVLEHAFGKIAKRGRRWLLDVIAAPRLGQPPDPLLRELVGGELARVGAIEDPDFRVKAFKTEQWSFRWTLASIRMFQAAAFPRLPFYDTRLTDFFATVPSAMVSGRRLQIDYLKRFAPDLARIKWHAFDTNLYRYRYFDTLLLPSRALKKAARLLRSSRPPERNWEVQFLSERGRRDLEGALLKPGSKLHELVSAEDLRALLVSFFAAPFEDGRGYTVSMLLTLSSWLEAHG
ncbi:MAG TPA: asparagine synthase-related protein [Thermoanaerobaculia bacterium]|nr:asparagine synthase-related protein [Thermoanaerobaculia bacterium]